MHHVCRPRANPARLFIPGWGRNEATFRSERHLPCDNLSTRPRGELPSPSLLLFPPHCFAALGFDECSLAHNTSLRRQRAESQKDTEGMWKVYPWHASPPRPGDVFLWGRSPLFFFFFVLFDFPFSASVKCPQSETALVLFPTRTLVAPLRLEKCGKVGWTLKHHTAPTSACDNKDQQRKRGGKKPSRFNLTGLAS